MDLTPYKQILHGRSVGEGAEVELEEGETPRVQKRRFSTAAKELGLHLRWRKARDNTIKFAIVEPPTPEQTQKRVASLEKARQARAASRRSEERKRAKG